MPADVKFPSTPEIKRVLLTLAKIGVDMGSVEVEPRKITVHPPPAPAYVVSKPLSAYERAFGAEDAESDAWPGRATTYVAGPVKKSRRRRNG